MSSEQKDQPPPYQEIAGHQGGGYGTVPTQDQCQQGGYNQAPAYPQGGYNQGPPPGIYPQPQGAGYDPSKYQGAYQPQSQSYQSVGVVVQQQPAQQVVLVGGCPACRVGVLEEDYTCLGVLCAILFFPLGILCCLAMRQRRCPSCGAVFD